MRKSPPVRMNRSGGGRSASATRAANRRFVDVVRLQAAGGDVLGQAARGRGDVLAAAVAGGDGQRQPGVVAGDALRRRPCARGSRALKRSRSPMKRMRTPRRCSSATSRSSAFMNNFISAPTSSSGRPQFSLENANSVSASMPCSRQKSMHRLHRARAGAMADGARAPALLRPAAVAVHDDGEVARDAVRRSGEVHDIAAVRPPSAPVPWP